MASPHQSRLSGQVVAGLTDNAVSASVVIVAAEESRRRQARITFIHVVPQGQNRDDHADAAAAMFRTVLRATGAGDIPYTFETMTGDAAAALVESCRDADLLVLGADDLTATARVADYCLEHCVCPVRVVTEENDSPAEARASVILSPDDLKADRRGRVATGRGGSELSGSRSARTT